MIIEIVTVNAFDKQEKDILLEELKDKVIKICSIPLFRKDELMHLNFRGNTEYMEQKYILKISVDDSKVKVKEPFVFFKNLKCYIGNKIL